MCASQPDVYDRDFFAMHGPWRAEYEGIADALARRLQFSSVLDLGCGTAFLIARLAQLGKQVQGVEGSPAALEFIPETVRHAVVLRDLTVPFDPGRHDLVICSEVAEHLPERYAETLVQTICGAAAEWVFFTAAVPGQGGFGHVNEQPHDYWIARFARRGLRLDASVTGELRAELAKQLNTTWWFSRNAMLFRCGTGEP